ncbi:hypothetical protein [Ignicoccus islandicus]|nr:hypothetical protein [Ignicoccus islandicus]
MPIEGSNALNQGFIGVPLRGPPRDKFFLYILVRESIVGRKLSRKYEKFLEKEISRIVEEIFENRDEIDAKDFIEKFFSNIEERLNMRLENKEILYDFFTTGRTVKRRGGEAIELIYNDLAS